MNCTFHVDNECWSLISEIKNIQKLCKVAGFCKQLLGRYYAKIPQARRHPSNATAALNIHQRESSWLRRLAFQKTSWHSLSLASHRMSKLNKQYLCAVNVKNHCWFMHDGSPRVVTWNQKPKLFQCTASDRSSWQWWKTLRRKEQLKQKLIYFCGCWGFFSPCKHLWLLCSRNSPKNQMVIYIYLRAVTYTQQCQFGQDQPRKVSLDSSGFQTTFLRQQHKEHPTKKLSVEHQVADHVN